MIKFDKFLGETLIAINSDIDKLIKSIDRYITNVGTYPSSCDDSIMRLYQDILQQMIRKSKLIKFKEIFRSCVASLPVNEKQVYGCLTRLKQLKVEDVCELINIKPRTYYRTQERLFQDLATKLSEHNDNKLFLEVCNSEKFIRKKYEIMKTRRQSYRKEKQFEDEVVLHG